MPTGGLIAGIGDFGVVDLINEATQDATAEAQTFADEANAAAQTVGNVVNRELQILPVKAGQGMNIGTPVYVSGADGTNIVVSPASNASEATSSKVIGLLMQNLANNGQGSVVTGGKLVGLNTSTATLGNPVWLGVNGALIYGLTNKPVAPAHPVYLGVVSRVHATLGEIIVHIQNGFEMNEIHDYMEVNKQDGDAIQYDASLGLYRNKTNDKFVFGANDICFSGGSIAFESTSKRIVVNGGLLNRLGTYTVLSNVIVDLSSITSSDYGLYLDPSNNTLSIASYTTNTAADRKYCLARFTWNGTLIQRVNYCISDYYLDGVDFKKVTASEKISAVSEGNVLYDGLITLNSATKTCVISGSGILNRMGTFVPLSGTNINMTPFANGDYGVFVSKSGEVSVQIYTLNVINNNLYLLIRFTWTDNVFTKVRYCICDYNIDGLEFLKNSRKPTSTSGQDTTVPTSQKFVTDELLLANSKFVFGAGDNVLYNGNIEFDSTGKKITVNGGIINRLGTYYNINAVIVSVSSLAQFDYGLYFDPSNNALSIASYTTNTSADRKYCLARFSWTGSIFEKVWYCMSNEWSIDGVQYTKTLTKSGIQKAASSLKWCQIGDSITIQDNKKEDDGSGNGYQGYGWGQRICTKLGIPYQNHYPRGFNGNSLVNVASIFSNTPTNVRTTLPTADLYSIFLGTNDWGIQQAQIGTQADYINNTFDNTPTSYGALRRLIDLCLGRHNSSGIISDKGTAIPRIVLITPMRRGLYGYKLAGTLTKSHEAPPSFSYDSNGSIVETINSQGFSLKQICDMIKWVGQYEGLKVIDLQDDSRFVPLRYLNTTLSWNPTLSETAPPCWNDILSDNLHPSSKGYDLLFSRVYSELISIIPEIIK